MLLYASAAIQTSLHCDHDETFFARFGPTQMARDFAGRDEAEFGAIRPVEFLFWSAVQTSVRL